MFGSWTLAPAASSFAPTRWQRATRTYGTVPKQSTVEYGPVERCCMNWCPSMYTQHFTATPGTPERSDALTSKKLPEVNLPTSTLTKRTLFCSLVVPSEFV
jgi:hypothetical protein